MSANTTRIGYDTTRILPLRPDRRAPGERFVSGTFRIILIGAGLGMLCICASMGSSVFRLL